MPVKKRRVSPSASSASSTPAPPSFQPDSSVLSSSFPSAPTEGLAGPGPSTLSHQSQSRRERNDAAERRQYARLGVQVPGSGDGEEYGEECFLWADVPIVKNFRYAPCAISPTPSPHPRYPFHRTIPYPPSLPPVHISWIDRSSYIHISPSALTISNDRGFRSARANVAVREGIWYFEVKIERGNGSIGSGKGHLNNNNDSGNAHVRIGWGRREANLDSPVGSDGYSYSIRDVNLEKVHLSRPKPYGVLSPKVKEKAGDISFKTGDIIGCLINLPPRPSTKNLSKTDPGKIKRTRRQFIYKNQSYFETPEYLPSKEMDSLIDREGKLLAEKKQAEKDALNGISTEGINGDNNGDNIPKKGSSKKGATTKNTKKKKEENIQIEPPIPVSRPLKKLEGSSIEFYLNGESLGIAFEDLYDFIPLSPPLGKKINQDEIIHDDGTLGYYPMISCFGKGKARFNPGPDFIFPPNSISNRITSDDNEDDETSEIDINKIRPICERFEEFRTEELEYDEQDEIEGTIRLKEIFEEEEKLRMKSLLSGNSTKRKKGNQVIGKKKKIDITENIKGSNSNSTPNSRGGTATPAPEEHLEDELVQGLRRDRYTPGIDDSIKEEEQNRERSNSIIPPSTINSVPPTRGSSPNSNIIYQEIAEQGIVVEDTPKSPAPLDNDIKDENLMDVDVRSSIQEKELGDEGVHEREDDEEEGVKW